MGIINMSLPVTANLANCSYAVDKLSLTVDKSIKLASGIKKSSYSIGKADPVSPEAEKNQKIAKMIKKINRYKKIIQIVESIPAILNEIMSYCIENIEYFASQIIMKSIQIVALRIKKLIVSLKKSIARLTKSILQLCMSGTGNVALSVLIAPVILLFKSISILATGILTGIQIVLDCLPPIIAVNAEGMCFFMTPKSLQKTDMTVANAKQSIVYRLPNSVMSTLHEVLKTIDRLNIPLKVSAVSAGAALGAAAIKDGKDLDIPCSALSRLDPKNLFKLIEAIVKIIPLAQPLPKFENISLTNLGFLVWLITGFEPAGRSSFGMPGQP